MTRTTTWIIATLALAGLSAGGYFAWKKWKSPGGGYGNNTTHQDRGQRPGQDKGVTTATTGKATTLTEPNWHNPFDMGYAEDVKQWVFPKTVIELYPDIASRYALQLKNAKGTAWYKDDDELTVKQVFTSLKDKVQVANLSAAFYRDHGTDMWRYLSGFLSDSEMEHNVHQPVNKLPKYRTR